MVGIIKKYRILIVDDHELIFIGYKNALLNKFPDIENIKLTIHYSKSIKNAINKMTRSNFPYDLIVLDLNLPKSKNFKMLNGEDLGRWIRKKYPNLPIIIISTNNSKFRINSVMESLNPEGYLVKSEITSSDFVHAVYSLLLGKYYYGKSIAKLLKKRISNYYEIDSINILIMQEISNGTKGKDLCKYIPLSKSGIEKRKRKLMDIFNSTTDRELIISAKKQGYI